MKCNGQWLTVWHCQCPYHHAFHQPSLEFFGVGLDMHGHIIHHFFVWANPVSRSSFVHVHPFTVLLFSHLLAVVSFVVGKDAV
jgi:hypothetical protein